MNAEQRRRTSKLAGSRAGIVGGPDRTDPEPASESAPPREPQPDAEEGAPPPPRSRSGRRKTTAGPVYDTDMVSFNCKMSRGLRRQVRHYAAEHDVDVQDVVWAALRDYLAARGMDVPDQ